MMLGRVWVLLGRRDEVGGIVMHDVTIGSRWMLKIPAGTVGFYDWNDVFTR
jgi:hypothetical protein